MKITTTDQAIRALMQRLARENLQVLALIKLGYKAREIDKIIQTGEKGTRSLGNNPQHGPLLSQKQALPR